MSQTLLQRSKTEAELADVMRIRFTVFVDEQNVPPELEPDEYDAEAIHLLLVDSDTSASVGTARIVNKGNGIAKIGRVAILREWRGKGMGEVLMQKTMELAREHGFTSAILDAQTYVIGFYERFGFVAEGPVFDDAGIPHRRMTCVL
jgi:predicted GNAT family N-acyltransferase